MKRIDDRPRHAQIAADLRAKILSGDITGTLPTFKLLKDLYNTSTNTAQRAVALLKAEGFVEGQQGKALIIRSDRIRITDAASQLEPPASTITYQVLHVGPERPPSDAAAKLGLADNETALLRKRLMLRDDDPVEIEWSYYPESVVTGTALDKPPHQIQRDLATAPTVLAALGWRHHGLIDEIQVREPTTEELQTLELPDEIPVMRTLRTITDAEGTVLEVTVMITSGHLYGVRYHQTLTPPASA
ncbi:GntR family transcriptional regulator [Catenulispora sp. GP43]|uniref:GntR family transcriptional regulator n=1 Tax=Catenulispora sp. GP43 TaxID=3156263 RepID=UPI003516C673